MTDKHAADYSQTACFGTKVKSMQNNLCVNCSCNNLARIISLTEKITFEKVYTRGDQKVRGKKLPFLHRLTNKAGISYNSAKHMQLIGHNMVYVSGPRMLQVSSGQR